MRALLTPTGYWWIPLVILAAMLGLAMRKAIRGKGRYPSGRDVGFLVWNIVALTATVVLYFHVSTTTNEELAKLALPVFAASTLFVWVVGGNIAKTLYYLWTGRTWPKKKKKAENQ